ncbi:MAG TPA: hypothetical protein ACQGQG_05175 [Xylella sp.]
MTVHVLIGRLDQVVNAVAAGGRWRAVQRRGVHQQPLLEDLVRGVSGQRTVGRAVEVLQAVNLAGRDLHL